jgi:flagellar biosynthesis protein FlhB
VSTQEDSGGEKIHDPSEKKLDQAREKGDIVKSQDISVTASYLGLALAFLIAGPAVVQQVGSLLGEILSRANTLGPEILGANGDQVALGLFRRLVFFISPIFGLPILAVVASIIAQRAVTFTPDKIQPKLSRISLISGVKNKFGLSGLFKFLKSLVKLLVISTLVGIFVTLNSNLVLGSIFMTGEAVSRFMVDNLLELVWLVFAIALVISVLDYMWQKFDHKRKLMMSRQEMMDETKESEGDPHFKQRRRQRGYDIATQRMLNDVPDADVIIVNPQHFAVALKWDRQKETAPVCIAKGVDEIAARIREIASQAGVPIHSDPPTARMIFATVKVGQEVLPDQYRAVASAIRFAEKMRGLAQNRGAK